VCLAAGPGFGEGGTERREKVSKEGGRGKERKREGCVYVPPKWRRFTHQVLVEVNLKGMTNDM
jgi:hypothetical protein